MECHTGDFTTETRRIEMVDTFASGPSLMAALETAEAPDYVLVDMEFQGEPTGGLLITRRLHERYPEVKIIIFSGRFDNPLASEENRTRRINEIGSVVMEALRLGASAFVSKNAASEISSKLGESDKAIQERQKDLSRRLDIVNKSAARVAKALSLGLIAPTDINFLPRG